MPEATAAQPAIDDAVDALRDTDRAWREMVRHLVLVERRVDVLYSQVLGYLPTPFHLQLIADQSAARERTDRDTFVQVGPRGSGKTTALTVARAVAEVLWDPNIRILLASKTQAQAEGFLREIAWHLSSNERFLEVFGAFLTVEDKSTTKEVTVGLRTKFKREATVSCVGVGGAVPSRHYDTILADDIVDQWNARTEAQRTYMRTWFYQTLLPTLEPYGRMFYNGTRYHPSDLSGHMIANECKDAHVAYDCFMDETESVSFWPERFPLAWLKERRTRMGTLSFNLQYRARANEGAGTRYDRNWFEIVPAAPSLAEVVRYWDRAGTDAGKAGAGTSWTVGVKLGRDYRDPPTWYVVDVVRFQGSPLAVQTKIKNVATQDGRSVIVGIEEDPGQAGKAEAQFHVRNLAGYRVVVNRVHESKGIRSRPFEAQCEAGNVKLVAGEWNPAYLDEHEAFDGGEDCASDQVDASTGGFHVLAVPRKLAGVWGR